MDENLTLYCGSVAEALIALAVLIISGVALTTGYTVVKKNQQRRFHFAETNPAWDSFATWLVITVEVVLAVHLIKAVFWPNWLTLSVAGAIAIIQIVLNGILSRDLKSAYLPLHNEDI